MFLSSDVWGPKFWFFLQTVAMTYPEQPDARSKKKYYDLIQNFPTFLPNKRMGKEFAKKCLHDAGVAIVPGTAFGKKATDYVRFSFAASQDNISKALENIKKIIE